MKGARAKRSQRSESPLSGVAAGVVSNGARGDVWRAAAMQAHLMGVGALSCGPPGLGARMRGQRASSARAASSLLPAELDARHSGERGSNSRSQSSRPQLAMPTHSFNDSKNREGANEGVVAHTYAQLDYNEKLRRHQASLTLAQRMGLVAEPSCPLTSDQWEAVKKASDLRQDSDAPCSICLDDFRERPQVILSCSHVFHGECLRSFERFSGERRCPLCRTSSYDATPHFGGFMVWRTKCACRIQRAWRGYCSRSEIWRLQLAQPDAVRNAPVLRRRFCGRALKVAGDRLGKACEEREDALDRFLESLDKNLKQSSEQLREGLQGFEQLHGPSALGSAEVDLTPPETFDTRSRSHPHDAQPVAGTPPDASNKKISLEEWGTARAAALSRGDEVDCPICFQPCKLHGRGGQHVELLSCSHVFHRCCVMSFESFHVFEVHICPVCRQSYERRPFNAPLSNEAKQVSLVEVGASGSHSSGGYRRFETSVANRSRPPLGTASRGYRTQHTSIRT